MRAAEHRPGDRRPTWSSTAPGGVRREAGDVRHTLESDVVTNVKTTVGGQDVLVPTIYEDIGQVTLRMALKDVGNGIAVAAPTPATPSPSPATT